MNDMAESIQKIGRPSLKLRDRLVQDVMNFVYQKLPGWRDDPQRTPVDAEKKLNEQLCTYLSVESRREEKLYTFNSDVFQEGERQVDFAAMPLKDLILAHTYSSIYKTITVIEAKRLPAPKKSREKEYLTGEKFSGGIQRYKLMLHGAKHEVAGMIGYVQRDSLWFYYVKINEWIDELAKSNEDNWSVGEKLHQITIDSSIETSRAESNHVRKDGSVIFLYHLWVKMNLVSGD